MACHGPRIPTSVVACSPPGWTSCTAAGSPPAASRTSPTRPACRRARSTPTSPARRRSPRRSSSTTGPTSSSGCCRSSTRTGRRRSGSSRFFHALADEHEAGDFLLGCLIGNLSLELGGSSDAVRDQLASILDRWDAALTACVRSGQRRRRRHSDRSRRRRTRRRADRGVGGRGPSRQGDPQSHAVRPLRSGHRPGAAALSRRRT